MESSRAHGQLPTTPMGVPSVMRSRLMLEVACELVATDDWEERQTRIQFRQQGAGPWNVCLFGSDAPSAVESVASGESDFAIVNPGSVLAMARQGMSVFKTPVPVCAITVLPQFDQFGFGVLASTGLTSLEEVRDRKYPLKLTLRGQRDHSIHLVVNEVFQTLGFSVDDLVSWGGEVRYDNGMPWAEPRMGAIRRGELNAMFDEALPWWADTAIDAGMTFLSLSEPNIAKLTKSGMRRVVIPKSEYPQLGRDVPTVDFSGWPVFCLESTPDARVRAFCAGLEARKNNIPWHGEGPLPLHTMCRDTEDGPMTIPLHPAAERFWREQGYLD